MFCPGCGKKIEEDAVYCPFCGAKLAEAPAQPPTAIKRHVAITASIILLCVFSLMHVLNMIDFITYEYTTGIILQLFFGAFALVAAYFLWKSEGMGGVLGIIYAVLQMLCALSAFLYPEGLPGGQYTLFDLALDTCINVVLIILIVIGRKSLRFE